MYKECVSCKWFAVENNQDVCDSLAPCSREYHFVDRFEPKESPASNTCCENGNFNEPHDCMKKCPRPSLPEKFEDSEDEPVTESDWVINKLIDTIQYLYDKEEMK